MLTISSLIVLCAFMALVTLVLAGPEEDRKAFRKWGMISTPEEFLLVGAYIEEKRYMDITFDDYARQKGREPSPEVFLTPVDGHVQ